MIIEFLHDDGGYLDWLEQHPAGFVLNCSPRPTAASLLLHRAACRTINGTPARGRSWTAAYQKVCSDSVDELDRWAADVGPLTACARCRPR